MRLCDIITPEEFIAAAKMPMNSFDPASVKTVFEQLQPYRRALTALGLDPGTKSSMLAVMGILQTALNEKKPTKVV
jgi:hypothetical protein